MAVAELIESVKKLPLGEQREIEAVVRTRVERRSAGHPTAIPRMEFREGRIQMRRVVNARVPIKWP